MNGVSNVKTQGKLSEIKKKKLIIFCWVPKLFLDFSFKSINIGKWKIQLYPEFKI